MDTLLKLYSKQKKKILSIISLNIVTILVLFMVNDIFKSKKNNVLINIQISNEFIQFQQTLDTQDSREDDNSLKELKENLISITKSVISRKNELIKFEHLKNNYVSDKNLSIQLNAILWPSAFESKNEIDINEIRYQLKKVILQDNIDKKDNFIYKTKLYQKNFFQKQLDNDDSSESFNIRLSEIVEDYNLDLLETTYIISNLDAYYSLLKTNFDDFITIKIDQSLIGTNKTELLELIFAYLLILNIFILIFLKFYKSKK